ncbi:hypothetical protein AC1031_022007 [Aphanomyces cochlioides]|nr:hypothetical protein AC1031_022007 [Aphanomyces cochlioides]
MKDDSTLFPNPPPPPQSLQLVCVGPFRLHASIESVDVYRRAVRQTQARCIETTTPMLSPAPARRLGWPRCHVYNRRPRGFLEGSNCHGRVPFYPLQIACHRLARQRSLVLFAIVEDDSMCESCRSDHLSVVPACVSVSTFKNCVVML